MSGKVKKAKESDNNFLLKVYADGRIEGDYWARLEAFEFAKVGERIKRIVEARYTSENNLQDVKNKHIEELKAEVKQELLEKIKKEQSKKKQVG